MNVYMYVHTVIVLVNYGQTFGQSFECLHVSSISGLRGMS